MLVNTEQYGPIGGQHGENQRVRANGAHELRLASWPFSLVTRHARDASPLNPHASRTSANVSRLHSADVRYTSILSVVRRKVLTFVNARAKRPIRRSVDKVMVRIGARANHREIPSRSEQVRAR